LIPPPCKSQKLEITFQKSKIEHGNNLSVGLIFKPLNVLRISFFYLVLIYAKLTCLLKPETFLFPFLRYFAIFKINDNDKKLIKFQANMQKKLWKRLATRNTLLSIWICKIIFIHHEASCYNESHPFIKWYFKNQIYCIIVLN